ncbi:MAG: hypothetical protein ACK5OX_09430 [Desertimonas sp.]
MPQLRSAVRLGLVAGLVVVAGCADHQSGPTGDSLDQPPPTAELEWAQGMRRCMAERGWSLEIMEDGGVTIDYPPGQEERGRADMRECGESVTPPIVALNDDELSDYYDALTGQIDCLRDAGFAYTELPSRERFVASGGAWSQFGGYPGPDEVNQARRACPDPEPE